MSLRMGVNRLSSLLNNLNITSTVRRNVVSERLPLSLLGNNKSYIHTTCVSHDLMEFFDDKENWGEIEVQVGRSWKVEELRIKSNSDLHKLWFVLLKERNMLLTMDHEHRRNNTGMPNPERIDKVEESMENLEAVVRERNRAYFELETGESGERPTASEINCFGLPMTYKMNQYPLPKKYNKKYREWYKLNIATDDHLYIRDFLRKLEEKKNKRAFALKRRAFRIVCNILKRFPNVDEEALKEQFPTVDIEEAKRSPDSRTHGQNAY